MEPSMQTIAAAEQFLHAIPLFEKCSPTNIQKLAMSVRSETYDKSETILFQGIISNQLFIVAAGMVAVFSRKDKVTRFITNLEKGAYFGEISLIKNCAATATVKAAVDGTEVLSLDYDAIKELLDTNAEAKQHLEQAIIERNRYRLEQFNKQKEELPQPAAAPVSTTY